MGTFLTTFLIITCVISIIALIVYAPKYGHEPLEDFLITGLFLLIPVINLFMLIVMLSSFFETIIENRLRKKVNKRAIIEREKREKLLKYKYEREFEDKIKSGIIRFDSIDPYGEENWI